ncbi:hypothetical protein ACRAWD_06985 [Caulobacter segnis]
MFGQASYQLTDKLTVTAGLRDTYDAKKTVLKKTSNNAANVSILYGPPLCPPGRRAGQLGPVGQLPGQSGRQRLRPRGPRASAARPSRAARRCSTPTSPRPTAQSIVSHAKPASRASCSTDTLRFNASAFTYDVSDIQLNGNDSKWQRRAVQRSTRPRAYGVEADLEWRPVRNLLLTAGASYLHSEIKDKRVYAQVCALNGVVVCYGREPDDQGGGQHLRPDRRPAAAERPEVQPELHGPLRHPGRRRRPRLRRMTDWNVQGYTNFVLHKTREFYSKGLVRGAA